MKAQLSLFTPPPPDLSAATWRTGVVPYMNSEMRHGYVHLIRAPDDPERMCREERRAQGNRDLAPHRTIDKTPVIGWKRLIRNLLVDRSSSTGHPAADREKDIRETFTFNRIVSELADVTADIAYQSNADAALWQLVEDAVLSHTLEAPIFFRLSDRCMLTDGVFDRMDGNGWRWCTECTKLMPWDDHLDCQSDSCACRDPDADEEELAADAVGRAQAHALRRKVRHRYMVLAGVSVSF